MKKIVLLAWLLPSIAFSQEEDTMDLQNYGATRHNEFRIDAVELIVAPYLEITYEHIPNKNSGFGFDVSINLDDENESYDELHDIALTGFYRQYFFNKKDYIGRGFFAEANARIATGDTTNETFIGDDVLSQNVEDWTQFGLGFAVGQKWVKENGFTLELSVGVGRYFGGGEDLSNELTFDSSYTPEFYFRGGVLIGYRFF